MYGFDKNDIPESFHFLDWQEKRERCNNDYGPPDRLHYTNYQLMTPEEEREFYLNLPSNPIL